AKSFASTSSAPGGSVTPSLRYFSALQSNSTNCKPAANFSFTRLRTRMHSRVTSMPMPSPGITAMGFISNAAFPFDDTVVFSHQSLQMSVFVLSKIHEDFPAGRIGNLSGKLHEEFMRFALEIHRNIQGFNIACLGVDIDLEQHLLRKNVF